MTAVYVIGAVLLLFVLMLFAPLKLYIVYYGKNLILKPCIAFIRFEVPILGTEDFDVPIEEKKEKAQEKPKKRKKATKRKRKRNFQRKDLGAVLQFIKGLMEKCLVRFRGYLKLEKYLLKINLATDDPAKTAILYGGLSGVVSGLHGLADGAKKRSRKKTSVYTEFTPDFYGTKTDIEIEIGFSLRLGEIIHCAFLAFPHLLRALWYYLTNFVFGSERTNKNTKGDTEDERILS